MRQPVRTRRDGEGSARPRATGLRSRTRVPSSPVTLSVRGGDRIAPRQNALSLKLSAISADLSPLRAVAQSAQYWAACGPASCDSVPNDRDENRLPWVVRAQPRNVDVKPECDAVRDEHAESA